MLQRYHALPSLMGRKVVTSCWVVRGLPVAACFREDSGRNKCAKIQSEFGEEPSSGKFGKKFFGQ